MRRLAVVVALMSAAVLTGTVRADEKTDAVLGELAAQLKEMRNELNALRQENQRLQALVAQQPQAQVNVDPTVHAPGGSETPANLFGDEPVRIYARPGGTPPSWLDMIIERNRMRTMEAWDRARANERLVDERLAKISAESRALGAGYMPRILREPVLAGGDAKQHRDRLVAARSSDFDALFGRTEVRDYLQNKANRLSSDLTSASSAEYHGSIAPASVRFLADRMRRNLEDTTILYGMGGLRGPAPSEYGFAEQMMRLRRDSTNPMVSGPTRDTLDLARRSAAVDLAVVEEMDIEVLTRMQQIKEANRRMGVYTPSPVHIAEDLAQVNSVLNGKISRTSVPEVHATQDFKPQGP